jgi:hypothetical protein
VVLKIADFGCEGLRGCREPQGARRGQGRHALVPCASRSSRALWQLGPHATGMADGASHTPCPRQMQVCEVAAAPGHGGDAVRVAPLHGARDFAGAHLFQGCLLDPPRPVDGTGWDCGLGGDCKAVLVAGRAQADCCRSSGRLGTWPAPAPHGLHPSAQGRDVPAALLARGACWAALSCRTPAPLLAHWRMECAATMVHAVPQV